ncbi:MAG: Uma2 family endonuclease [Dehalococcoidia bacterium]|nr:Uma2 family endonuclease [Dehalococcoidia bacterium]
MPVSEATYRALSLEDGDTTWELVCGHLRAKPPMTHAHGEAQFELAHLLRNQLDRDHYRVRVDNSRTRISGGTWYVPDIAVIPAELTEPHLEEPATLAEYAVPLPLVIEIWSRSTGAYDVDTKLPGYRERGDAEVWLVHPYDRTVTAWRRQPDGSYVESRYAYPAAVPVESLPGVRVELRQLFG